MFKVLVVEDNRDLQSHFKKYLEDRGVTVYQAFDFEEALRVSADHLEDLHGMIVDGCLNTSHFPDGSQFIREVVKAGYTGFIVACSESDDLNTSMLQDGATHKVRAKNYRGIKETAPDILMEVLDEWRRIEDETLAGAVGPIEP